MRRQHQGKTAGFFETGTEGIMWVIEVKLGRQKTPNQKKDVWGSHLISILILYKPLPKKELW